MTIFPDGLMNHVDIIGALKNFAESGTRGRSHGIPIE